MLQVLRRRIILQFSSAGLPVLFGSTWNLPPTQASASLSPVFFLPVSPHNFSISIPIPFMLLRTHHRPNNQAPSSLHEQLYVLSTEQIAGLLPALESIALKLTWGFWFKVVTHLIIDCGSVSVWSEILGISKSTIALRLTCVVILSGLRSRNPAVFIKTLVES